MDETHGSKDGLTLLDVFNNAFLCARDVIMAQSEGREVVPHCGDGRDKPQPGPRCVWVSVGCRMPVSSLSTVGDTALCVRS